MGQAVIDFAAKLRDFDQPKHAALFAPWPIGAVVASCFGLHQVAADAGVALFAAIGAWWIRSRELEFQERLLDLDQLVDQQLSPSWIDNKNEHLLFSKFCPSKQKFLEKFQIQTQEQAAQLARVEVDYGSNRLRTWCGVGMLFTFSIFEGMGGFNKPLLALGKALPAMLILAESAWRRSSHRQAREASFLAAREAKLVAWIAEDRQSRAHLADLWGVTLPTH